MLFDLITQGEVKSIQQILTTQSASLTGFVDAQNNTLIHAAVNSDNVAALELFLTTVLVT